MISVIIPTQNSAAQLSRTLAPLAPAAMGGFVKEVIVADAGSDDATLTLAEDSGCEIVRADHGVKQWIAGASAARGRWFLFLRPNSVLRAGWEDSALTFIKENHKRMRAASFTRGGLLSCLLGPKVDGGVLLSRTLYEALGGVRPNDADVNALIGRVGRWRVSYLG